MEPWNRRWQRWAEVHPHILGKSPATNTIDYHTIVRTHTHIHTIWLNITIKHYSFGIEQAKIVRWPANMMIFPLEMSFFLRARIVHHLVVVPGWKFWKSPSSPKCTFRWVIHVLRSLDLSLPLDLEGKLAWSLHFDITGPRPRQATDHGDSTLVATPSRNVKIWSPLNPNPSLRSGNLTVCELEHGHRNPWFIY